MTRAPQVTYGGIVTGIGTGLVVSSLTYWFENFGSATWRPAPVDYWDTLW